MTEILQDSIPYDTSSHRLPGVAPMDPADWLLRDEAFDQQMALRDRLVQNQRSDVIGLLDTARPAAKELLSLVLDQLRQDAAYVASDTSVLRPDGVRVVIDGDDPLGTAGRLIQEDLCLMEKPDGADEHVLTGAVLCFPAGWTLAEKLGRPLLRIHKPVEPYTEDLAKRVQRLFDGVQVGRPLWRFNALDYVNPSLFQPRKEGEPKYGEAPEQRYIRSERQSILRLPVSRAVVFGIHTFVLRKEDQKNGR